MTLEAIGFPPHGMAALEISVRTGLTVSVQKPSGAEMSGQVCPLIVSVCLFVRLSYLPGTDIDNVLWLSSISFAEISS